MKNLHKIAYALLALFTVAISSIGGNTNAPEYDAGAYGGVTITPSENYPWGYTAVLDETGTQFHIEEDCSVSVLDSAGSYIEGYESVTDMVDTQRALYPEGTIWRAVQNYNSEVAHCN